MTSTVLHAFSCVYIMMFTALGWLWPAVASGSHILMFHWELHLAAEAFVAAATNSWGLPSRYFPRRWSPWQVVQMQWRHVERFEKQNMQNHQHHCAIKMYESHSKPTSAQIWHDLTPCMEFGDAGPLDQFFLSQLGSSSMSVPMFQGTITIVETKANPKWLSSRSWHLYIHRFMLYIYI